MQTIQSLHRIKEGKESIYQVYEICETKNVFVLVCTSLPLIQTPRSQCAFSRCPSVYVFLHIRAIHCACLCRKDLHIFLIILLDDGTCSWNLTLPRQMHAAMRCVLEDPFSGIPLYSRRSAKSLGRQYRQGCCQISNRANPTICTAQDEVAQLSASMLYLPHSCGPLRDR